MAKVIMDGLLPPVWTISWIRAYDLGGLADLPPRDLFALGAPQGVDLLQMEDHEFFDIQGLRRGHFARVRIPSIPVSGVLTMADGRRPFEGEVSVHLLAHASGFLIIRPTLVSANARVDGEWSFS